MTQTVDDNGEAQYEESDDDIDELFDADEDYGDGNSEQYYFRREHENDRRIKQAAIKQFYEV